MIVSLARRANPEDASVLIALATDPDPSIRAAVASALSYWLVTGVSSEIATDALTALLADQGTLLARRVVAEWPGDSNERLRPLAMLLLDHPSARVRAAAIHVIGAA